jgi:hypothetical protein
MFPVVLGLFESEAKESWTWFFHQLCKAIKESPLLAICSYACKGLTLVVKEVFPKWILQSKWVHPFVEEQLGVKGRIGSRDV